MEDAEFAAYVRQLTGKDTNTEALASLRGGAPTLVFPSTMVAPEESGTKVDPSKFAD